MIRSSNPALKIERISSLERDSSGVMTVQGSINRTMMLLGIAMLAATFTWRMAMTNQPAAIPLIALGSIGGFILVLITTFKMNWAPVTAPMYAILEGVALGSLSGFLNQYYPGLPAMALMLTFGVLACMLVGYKTGAIRPTERMKSGLIAALGGIILVSIVSFILQLLGIGILAGVIHGSGPVGILFSLVVVTLAAFFLILDFDFIVKGSEAGAPAYVEWYGAMGLLITLVWLYLEILHLLMKLQDRD